VAINCPLASCCTPDLRSSVLCNRVWSQFKTAVMDAFGWAKLLANTVLTCMQQTSPQRLSSPPTASGRSQALSNNLHNVLDVDPARCYAVKLWMARCQLVMRRAPSVGAHTPAPLDTRCLHDWRFRLMLYLKKLTFRLLTSSRVTLRRSSLILPVGGHQARENSKPVSLYQSQSRTSG
jgi:hypothetical protein